MSSLSWGYELWHAIGAVEEYSSSEVGQVDSLRHYLTDYAQLCLDFGQKQKDLVDKYVPKPKGKVAAPPAQSTTVSSFQDVVRLVGEIGIAYETLGNGIIKDVAKKLKELHKRQCDELKKQSKAKAEMLNVLKKSESALEAAKTRCYNGYRDMLTAREASDRCNNDNNMARNQQLKAQQIANSKSQDFDNLNKEYAVKLNEYNEQLKKYHYMELPNWCAYLETMDAIRCVKTTECLHEVITAERATLVSVGNLVNKMDEAVNRVDTEQNSAILIKANPTNEWIPGGKDLVNFAQAPSLDAMRGQGNNTSKPVTRKQVESRILICRKELDQKEKELLSVQGLMETYRKSQSGTELEKCAFEVAQRERQINSLNLIKSRLEREIQGLPPGRGSTLPEVDQSVGGLESSTRTSAPPRPPLPTDVSQDDMNSDSSDMSDTSDDEFPHTDHPQAVQPPHAAVPTAVDTQDALRPSGNSLAIPSPDYQGYCTVKFAFAPTADNLASIQNLLPVSVGEQFYVKTHSTAWTYVHSSDEQRQGYVPTDYLEIVFY